ncbi:MAG: hypothetical protein GVY26_20460 [Bacteroidetes bacterium]|jgi:hypothetical protein|nr:hypothetical protein [Bacteroidota bacterium]
MSANRIFSLLLPALLLIASCNKEDRTPATISLRSASINGGALTEGMMNVDTDASIRLVFSSSLDPAAFESALSLSPTVAYDLSYTNQSSQVTIAATLDFNTTYTLRISEDAIGLDGGRLEAPLTYTFTTREEGGASSTACTEATAACVSTLTLDNQATFPFYASFPIYEEQTWPGLTSAVIVVHGANRNADDYFSYLTSSLMDTEQTAQTVLIAPGFQEGATAQDGELYWSGNGWREGRGSAGANAVSAFEVVDLIISRLADEEHFPALEKIVVTGHSSGGLFTHLFAAANSSEAAYPDIEFEYIVANSQYFYYPDGQRVNESNNQLYTPSSCSGYTIWPFGYEVVPAYLSNTDAMTFNEHFTSRSVTYLLGNGEGPDGAFNDADCSATLLGSSRYQRGENMYRYMELIYGSGHAHQRVIVPGVGHDGVGMYASDTFAGLLAELLGE